MKKQNDPGKKAPADLPDVKKIEKKIQTDNNKKTTEVPDTPDDESYKKPPREMPERPDENEVETPKGQ